MTIGQEIDRMMLKLRQQRDELKLKAHLFKADARDEWEKVEGKWQQFESRAKQVGEAGEEAGEGIGGALKNLGDEMMEGYRKIRKSL